MVCRTSASVSSFLFLRAARPAMAPNGSPPPSADASLASALEVGDLAAALRAVGSGGGAGRAANRAALCERLGLHRKALKVGGWASALHA